MGQYFGNRFASKNVGDDYGSFFACIFLDGDVVTVHTIFDHDILLFVLAAPLLGAACFDLIRFRYR